MRRWLTVLIFFGILIHPYPVQTADKAIKISSLRVELWPEFDKPSMLVINYITLSPDTALPATLIFHLPATAEGPSALAVGQTLDTVSDHGIDYSVQPQGNVLNLTIKAKGPAIQLEYYDSIQKDDKARKYFYQGITDYNVNSFKLTVQQPIGAKSFQTVPALASSETRNDNLKYYSGDFGALTAGTSFSLSLSYEKASDTLSVSSLQVQPSQPIGPDTPGSAMYMFRNDLPYILGGLGLLLIAGGMFYFWQSGGRKNKSRQRLLLRTEAEGNSEVYCHQCGTRAQKGDRFCRVCGTKLRREA
jgi:zinc-ribbon domain